RVARAARVGGARTVIARPAVAGAGRDTRRDVTEDRVQRIELSAPTRETGGVERELRRCMCLSGRACDGDARCLNVELRFLPKDRDLKLADLSAGVYAEIVGEDALGVRGNLERASGLAVAVEREHQLCDEPFTSGHPADEIGQIANEFAMPAEVEFGRDALFDGGDALLVEPRAQPLAHTGWQLGRQHGTAPEAFRVAQSGHACAITALPCRG